MRFIEYCLYFRLDAGEEISCVLLIRRGVWICFSGQIQSCLF